MVNAQATTRLQITASYSSRAPVNDRPMRTWQEAILSRIPLPSASFDLGGPKTTLRNFGLRSPLDWLCEFERML